MLINLSTMRLETQVTEGFEKTDLIYILERCPIGNRENRLAGDGTWKQGEQSGVKRVQTKAMAKRSKRSHYRNSI